MGRSPLSLLIIRKNNILTEFKKVADYLKQKDYRFYYEDEQDGSMRRLANNANSSVTRLNEGEECPQIDLVICLGGDGTVLRSSSLFPGKVPPILSFNLGTLGFLPAFSFRHFESVLDHLLPIFNQLNQSNQLDTQSASLNIAPFSLLHRMRLSCSLTNSLNGEIKKSGFQIMNEVAVHRGHNVQLGHIDTFINDNYLTDAVVRIRCTYFTESVYLFVINKVLAYLG
jgi:NAD kinase